MKSTNETYDSIADQYLERWQDRSPIQIHAKRFIDMLQAYQLTDYPILDVGCGPGFDAAGFRESGLNVIGLDLSMNMILAGRKRYPGDFVQGNMSQLPFTQLFGGLWISASLLHLPRNEVPLVLAGFTRVLNTGGIMYLSLKRGQGQGWEYGDYDRSRFFTYWQASAIDACITSAGFQIVDGWQGPGVRDEWLIRFARKNAGQNLLKLNDQDNL